MSSEQVRDRILQCALQLFSEKGFDAAGIMEICNASGITKPTLYYYFSCKDGLYEALWQEKFSPFQEKLLNTSIYRPKPAVYEQDVIPVLISIIKTYEDFSREEPAFFKMLSSLMFAPPASSGTALAKKYAEAQIDILRSMFLDMAAAHGNLKGKQHLLAVTFLGMIFSYIALGTSDTEPEALARQFMHGIFS